ncbi:alpha/beta fold hydrolase [Aliiglaciecola sp. M165]|uniref:alpha/beta fold hydrolase n=1 Tax=Aliiglaciecola sp. M165 TaxID=2593649 RepID=UPI00117E8416|nr:alpha/beta fold hydrolase [Aliiglaciecola sp. M165]TRY32510.1 alpha/beta hydrolase [Aliiglaciecola sp. M165]
MKNSSSLALARTLCVVFITAAVSACSVTAPTTSNELPAYRALNRLPLDICKLDGIEEPLLCGTLDVYENRLKMSGTKIPIKFVVIPAIDEPHTNSAWIEHVGGPRYSMIANARYFAKGGYLEVFRQRRDVVLIDPRGLHESSPLYCEALSKPRILQRYYPPKAVKACRGELEDKADLSAYSTLNAIDDYEEIRKWLGYAQWDVGGWSYGARFMLTYLHTYPQSIRSVILAMPSILNFQRPLDYARFGQQAFDRLELDCQQDAQCHANFPNVRQSLNAVLTKLDKHPVKIDFFNPDSGKVESRILTRDIFAESIWVMLLDTREARQLPFILSQAVAGDFSPFIDLAVPKSPQQSEPEGHYFSVVCPEETGQLDQAITSVASKDTFVGNYIAKDYIEACEAWGLPLSPNHPMTKKRFPTPALIITGEQDPVTPPVYGEINAEHFDNVLHISLPHTAHGISALKNTHCLPQFLNGFVESASLDNLDMSCVRGFKPPAFRLD